MICINSTYILCLNNFHTNKQIHLLILTHFNLHAVITESLAIEKHFKHIFENFSIFFGLHLIYFHKLAD